MPNNLLVYLTHPHVDTWNFKPQHREILQTLVPGLEVTVCYHSAEFLQKLPDAEAAIVWYFKKEWLSNAPRLKLICTPAAGNDWIEAEASENLKISHGGFHGLMIAESVTGAIFYFCKAFHLSATLQKQRKWATKKVSDHIKSLYEANVTILGFGRIGTTIGKVLKPFGCNITAVKRAPVPVPDYFSQEDRIVTADQLAEVLNTTDHLIMVLPGGSETQGIFKREHFRALPKTCTLYNVGRGNVYKEEDLVAALNAGEIAGAYLDVFEKEPLPPESLLWDMSNVLIQPHLSAASPQYLELFVREFAERINSGESGGLLAPKSNDFQIE
ncbi:MAG: hydroxyacid dehydrogenase [Nitrospinaceae bacterium]|nr:MAG: hydroxyacid dehydrogenase [Nitrospinaceae bacterium]